MVQKMIIYLPSRLTLEFHLMVQKMIIYKTDYRTFSSSESSNDPSLEGEKSTWCQNNNELIAFYEEQTQGLYL